MQTITDMGITEEPDLQATLVALAKIGYLAEQQPLLQVFLDFESSTEKEKKDSERQSQ